MKTSNKIAALLATLATTFAVGCAAPSDVTDSSANEPDVVVPVEPTDELPPEDPTFVDPFAAEDTSSLPSDLTNIILDKLKDHSTKLLLKQVGLDMTNGPQLDRISQDLNKIKEDISETDRQIQQAIAYSAISRKVDSTAQTRSAIHVALETYGEVIVAQRALTVAQERGNADEIATAERNLERSVRVFVFQFEIDGVMNRAHGNIHNALAGSGQGDLSLIDLYRWGIRQRARLLTSSHTKALAYGLEYFENYQAIASFLQAECNAAVQFGVHGTGRWQTVSSKGCSVDDRENTYLHDRLERDLVVQRGQLPTPIPPGVIIDQVSNHQGLEATTRNKPMFVTIPGTYTWRPSDTVTTPGSARQRVAQMVYWSGHNTDWRIPSKAELDPIFAGARGDMRVHLNAVFGTTNEFNGQGFIWTNANPTVLQRICYDRIRFDYSWEYYTHAGFTLGTNGVEHRGYPIMPYGDCTLGSRARADQVANEQWATVRGGIIATRVNPMVDYM